MSGSTKIDGKSKDLGQIAAMVSGPNPPENIKILWYDETETGDVCPIKYYNLVSQTWKSLGT